LSGCQYFGISVSSLTDPGIELLSSVQEYLYLADLVQACCEDGPYSHLYVSE